MTTLCETVTRAREQISAFKNHATGEANLAEQVETGPLSDLPEIGAFAAQLRARFEIIEAILYHRRHDLTDETVGLASWAHAQGGEIIIRKEGLDRVTPGSTMEELGKLWIRETIEWALDLLHHFFPSWGYGPEILQETGHE